jgi:hypothetical protein
MYRVDLRVTGDGVDLDTELPAALGRIAEASPASRPIAAAASPAHCL